jgi:hypothetical protein
MKSAINLYNQAGSHEAPQSNHQEWTIRSFLRVVLAVALLTGVYFLASWIPVDQGEAGHSLFTGFIFFWIMGGIFTITLLALSDRNS